MFLFFPILFRAATEMYILPALVFVCFLFLPKSNKNFILREFLNILLANEEPQEETLIFSVLSVFHKGIAKFL